MTKKEIATLKLGQLVHDTSQAGKGMFGVVSRLPHTPVGLIEIIWLDASHNTQWHSNYTKNSFALQYSVELVR